jgi:hypothetical protein
LIQIIDVKRGTKMAKEIIKAVNIQPGMIIDFKPKGEFKHICLVTATSGRIDIEYTHFSLADTYCESMIGNINRDKNVGIIKGDMRKTMLKEFLDGAFDRLHNAERDVETVRLIIAMSEAAN